MIPVLVLSTLLVFAALALAWQDVRHTQERQRLLTHLMARTPNEYAIMARADGNLPQVRRAADPDAEPRRRVPEGL